MLVENVGYTCTRFPKSGVSRRPLVQRERELRDHLAGGRRQNVRAHELELRVGDGDDAALRRPLGPRPV